MENFQTLLITILIFIAIFYLIRNVNLWYWRINDIIENQNEQIDILTKQTNLLEQIFIKKGWHAQVVDEKPLKVNSNTRKSPRSNSQELDLDKDFIEKLKPQLKKDELIIKVKKTGKIEKWKKTDLEEVISIGNEDKFEVIYTQE